MDPLTAKQQRKGTPQVCHVLYAKVRSGWISIKGTLVPVLEQFDKKVSLKVSPLFFEIFQN